jgi:hypothetical protein
MRDVLLAVPTRGQIQWQTATALEAARDYMGEDTPPIVYQEGALSVALTRNRLVKRFLETDCQVLAMVDDDVAPPINFVEMLLPFLDGRGMVALPHASPHPVEQDKIMLCVYELDPGSGFLRGAGVWGGINDVEAVATGCVLIGRHVLEELGPAPFRMPSDPDAFLQSDDLIFCADLRAAGYKIGCLWEGIPVDHFRPVSIAPLAQAALALGSPTVLAHPLSKIVLP